MYGVSKAKVPTIAISTIVMTISYEGQKQVFLQDQYIQRLNFPYFVEY